MRAYYKLSKESVPGKKILEIIKADAKLRQEILNFFTQYFNPGFVIAAYTNGYIEGIRRLNKHRERIEPISGEWTLNNSTGIYKPKRCKKMQPVIEKIKEFQRGLDIRKDLSASINYTPHFQGTIYHNCPGFNFDNKDYILIEAEIPEDYKPVEGMIEIIGSEYSQMCEGE